MNGRVLLSLLFLAAAVCQSTAAEQKILKVGANEWKYLDTGEAPAKEWNQADFDDSQWKSGQAPLGYGDDDIKQTISFGGNEGKKNICSFFRRAVEVEDPTAAKKVVGKLICDDGCVVYVNGEEVHRFNLPDGELKSDTTAKFPVGGEIERHAFTFLVDADKFKPGKNVIAVRVHQYNAASSDVAFDLSLTGLDDDEAVKSAKQTHDSEQAQIKAAIEQGF
jgi:hypothetical protein